MSGNLGPLTYLLAIPLILLAFAPCCLAAVVAGTPGAELGRSKRLPRGYLFILLLTLLCIYWYFGISLTLVPFAIVLAALTVLLGFWVMPRTRLRPVWPVIAIAASAMIVMAVFPPVTESLGGAQSGALTPSYAHVFHSGFDGGPGYPDFVVDKSRLLLQWFVISAFGIAMCWLVTLRTKNHE